MTEIEVMRLGGWTIKEIAQEYGVKQSVITTGLNQVLHEERYDG